MITEQTLYMQNCLFIMNYMADECASFDVLSVERVKKNHNGVIMNVPKPQNI